MTRTRDLLAPFDDDVVEAIVADGDRSEAELRDALRHHQETIRSFRPVEDLVYEWRKYHDDPLIERTDDAYYLALPTTVWEELEPHLDLSEEAIDDVRSVHRKMVASVIDGDRTFADDDEAIVVTRE